MKYLKLNMKKRHIMEGYIFALPLIIGIIMFFAFPLYISFKLSFGELVKVVGFVIKWGGLQNFIRAFVIDTQFIPNFLAVIRQTLIKFPLIIVFSLILAVFMNRNIRFKGFFRIVFFMPFLLGTGYVMQQLLGQGVHQEAISTARQVFVPSEIMSYLGAGVGRAVDNFFGIIVEVLWSSGVQILLFLSGLQGIPQYLYESAKVDSATEWEIFWHVTLPMISPIMLLNIIYTIIDSFSNINNPLLYYIQTTAFSSMDFAYAAATGWIYFLFVLLVVILVIVIMRNHIYTELKGGSKNETIEL